jgi:hypothetical protein
VNWKGAGNPHNLLGGPIVYRVRTIRIGPHGWSVTGTVVNRTSQPLRIVYAHEPAGHNYVVISIGEAAAQALRFHPAVPTLLRQGEGWSGTFSGPDEFARGIRIRVQFGQFAPINGARYVWVTDHSYLVR